ncbi:flagellar assembly protein H [Fictibacillus macauensis ZFHKF-1]|uniref:Flagellar assembly protein FliH n=1 Tax=Fictibacillus macauensis ZFHKF-1 TaxID=1196324 RepID=I8AHA9_9BACL|nr:flagellar assembly protein FliH [Fictibacillus macauensis]EIT85082.1 flagellar assembly protein H [Fictibacillus macauensis ZFHKF-1]
MSLCKIIKASEINHTASFKPVHLHQLLYATAFAQADEEDCSTRLMEEALQAKKEADVYKEELQKQHQAEVEYEKQQVQIEIEQLRKETRQQAYEEGVSQGQAEGRAHYDEALQQVNKLTQLAQKEYESHIEKATPIIIELAVELAQKVVGASFEQDEQTFVSVLKQLLLELKMNHAIRLYVPVSWYEATLCAKEDLESVLEKKDTLSLYPDEQLQGNDFYVEYPGGKIEGGLDRQLLQLKEKLQEYVEEHNHERAGIKNNYTKK